MLVKGRGEHKLDHVGGTTNAVRNRFIVCRTKESRSTGCNWCQTWAGVAGLTWPGIPGVAFLGCPAFYLQIFLWNSLVLKRGIERERVLDAVLNSRWYASHHP